MNANNDQKFRDEIFHFGFEKGFIFSSANFSGTSQSNKFPVGFIVWDLNSSIQIEDQEIVVDVFDDDVQKFALKRIRTENRANFLSKWIDRPPATIKFPPLGSAISIKPFNDDRRDRIADGFLASFMCAGNDPQHQNNTALLSGPYVSAGALSVTPENFEKALVVHAVRRIPKANWINDRDQFMQPDSELSEEFVNDCTVWSIFSNSNHTASLRNVEYEGRVYQIRNHLFPFLTSDAMKWTIDDGQIAETLASGEDSFLARWLADRTLSNEAMSVMRKGREVYEFYFENLSQLPTTKFKIETWDAGWWQIRSALAEVNLGKNLFVDFKGLHGQLREKVLPQIYSFGFLT